MKCTYETIYQKNPYLIKGNVLLVSNEFYFDCPLEIRDSMSFRKFFNEEHMDCFDLMGFGLDELTFEVITQYQNLIRKVQKNFSL